jgi:heme exporter protein CcmD
MPDWLFTPRAPYVIAAYGATFVGIFGLLLFSWRGWKKHQNEWRRLQERR